MEDLIATVNNQDEKLQSLTKRVLYLESTLRETQSQSPIAMNTSDLLKLELDKLKQYSRRSCLVVSDVELPRNKTSEKAEETEIKARELFSREFGVALTKITLIMSWTKPADCQSAQTNRLDAIAY